MPDGDCAIYAINMLFQVRSVEERERLMALMLPHSRNQMLPASFVSKLLHPTTV